MSTPITIPRLGWSMEEGTFGEWLKAAGEPITPGDLLFSLEGEKATQEIEALDGGVLCIPSDAPRPGDIVQVGQIIGFVLTAGETAPVTVGTQGTKAVAAPSPPAVVPTFGRPASPTARRLAWEAGLDLDAIATPDPTGRIVRDDIDRAIRRPVSIVATSAKSSTPRARRRARELNIDWTKLTGTGRNNRVRERDVLTAAERSQPRALEAEAPSAPGHHQPATRLRRTIAQRMLAGAQQTAPVTITRKVNASALVAWRSEKKAQPTGTVIPTYNDMLLKLAAIALTEQPQINACWHRDGIYQYETVNIAIAIETESGLVAPVITDVASQSLEQITAQSRALIEGARVGKLNPAQLQGGTFTVTNLGMFDVDSFTPVINLPQAAILGVGRIVREPVVQDDAIVAGDTLTLSLTFDHRVIDGAPAARWLQRLCALIQHPETELSR